MQFIFLLLILGEFTDAQDGSRNLLRKAKKEKEGIGRMELNRFGTSHCAFRPSNMGPGQCCPGIDLACYGCNGDLDIPCEDQVVAPAGTGLIGRNCFCDASCIKFADCCDDHAETCPELQTTSSFLSLITATEIPKVTSKQTRPAKRKVESWIYTDMFTELKVLIKEKFNKSLKLGEFITKFEHLQFYMLNAERNCRLLTAPFVGEKNDGSMKVFDEDLKFIKNDQNDFGKRLKFLENIFTKYEKKYYKVTETTPKYQGCDGLLSDNNKALNLNGKQFKLIRLSRKILKLFAKINRRKP